MPHIQLGDLVQIKYRLPDGVKFIDEDKKFIVKEINYIRSSEEIGNTLRLIEV